jgi:S-adenosylmethionine hydrolase
VDPGVGTKRKAVVAKTIDNHFIVTPDNGSLSFLYEKPGIQEVRKIDETINRLKDQEDKRSEVFHGRDIFAYCAARLAAGVISYEEVGNNYPLEEIVRFNLQQARLIDGKIHGYLEIGDPNFGNLWTNIPMKLFEQVGIDYGDRLIARIYNKKLLSFEEVIEFYPSFGGVKIGEPLIYVNELSKIALAINQDSLMERHRLGYGVDWEVTFEQK